MNTIYCILFYNIIFSVKLISAHGMLYEPPNRASLWRFPEFRKYSPVECYTDTQFSCGGFGTQYLQNKGKCGVCGDPYQDLRPRENENGGKLGKNIITRNYTSGQKINVTVDLTSNHLGTFTFHLCSRGDNATALEEESCFEQHPLQLADGSGYVYHLPSVKKQAAGYFNTTLLIPNGVKCSYCTLRWHYRTGNSYGTCSNGTSAVGCGDQEIFRGCSDISIGDDYLVDKVPSSSTSKPFVKPKPTELSTKLPPAPAVIQLGSSTRRITNKATIPPMRPPKFGQK